MATLKISVVNPLHPKDLLISKPDATRRVKRGLADWDTPGKSIRNRREDLRKAGVVETFFANQMALERERKRISRETTGRLYDRIPRTLTLRELARVPFVGKDLVSLLQLRTRKSA